MQLPPRVQIRFLHEVFRMVSIAGFEIELRVQPACGSADKLLESDPVAGLTLDHQRLIAFVHSRRSRQLKISTSLGRARRAKSFMRERIGQIQGVRR